MKLTLFLTSCWLALAGLFTNVDKTILNGTVTDETGQALPGAFIKVTQHKMPIKATATDIDGKFSLELEPGIYDVEAEYAGFVSKRYTEIEVKKEVTNSILFRLSGGAVLSEVVVTGYNESLSRDASKPASYAADGLREAPASAPEEYSVTSRSKTKSAPKTTSTMPTSTPVDAGSVAMRGERSPAKKYYEDAVVPPPPPVVTGIVAPTETYSHEVAEPMGMKDEESADRKMDKPAPPGKSTPSPHAGLLTAGEWNDLHNWNRHWLDLLTDGEISAYETMYKCFPSQRYTVLLNNAADFPLADAYVKLSTNTGEILWESRTDNTGKAELWAGFFEQKEYKNLQAEAWVDGKQYKLGTPKPAKDGINRHQIQVECNAPKKVDIVWAVDATGSMGDEIEYLKTELLDVIGRAKGQNPELDFRMGTVFYRDKGDDYITKSSGLSPDINQTVAFIRKQSAGGGGDYPEAVHSALEEAIFSQKWSDQAIARICFLVLDASPHADQPEVIASIQRSIREAARLGIRIVPVTASGIQKDTEFLMKFFGLATNGTYVFLTDHSGIGGKHLEPTSDEYKVELLNDLLVRIITEYTTIKTCEGKSSIRFEEEQQQQSPDQALYYPNPANTQFTLELPVEVESVTIYDSEGKAVRKLEKPQSGRHTIVVSDLQEGFYTIRILHDNRMQSGKLMVIRV